MKLSVILPTIRTSLLPAWYKSLAESCNEHEFEVRCSGPYEPPEELISLPNFHWIESKASPTVCAQRCAIEAKGELLLHSVDDAIYYPNVVSEEINAFHGGIVGMRYRESENMDADSMPNSYWYCYSTYNLPFINPNWKHIVHFLMRKKLFIEYGGFDCRYDYLNFSTHQLLFLMQNDGIEIKLSKTDITNCSWMEGMTGDHKPIHMAQIYHDQPIFYDTWSKGIPNRPEIDNWKLYPAVWLTRFSE